MKKTIPSGLYITFEGPEGCGKSLQQKMLAERLNKEYSVVTTKQPGGIAINVKLPDGKEHTIRSLLLEPGFDLSAEDEAILFWYNDRFLHHKFFVKPALAEGKIVLGDRDFDSSWAYQCFAGGINSARMERMQEDVMGQWKPSLTFLYDGPVDALMKRKMAYLTANGSKEARFESKPIEYHERVRKGFLERAKNQQRFVVFDALKSIEELHEATYQKVKELISSREESSV